jgi:hypothetical protein
LKIINFPAKNKAHFQKNVPTKFVLEGNLITLPTRNFEKNKDALNILYQPKEENTR